MTLSFPGGTVDVDLSGSGYAYVVTTPFGDCPSVFTDVKKFESQMERNIWEEATIYRVSRDKVSLVKKGVMP